MFKTGEQKSQNKIFEFDEHSYLEANDDIKEAIKNGQFKDATEHLELYGLKEIKEGKRKFHGDFDPFESNLYYRIFPDLQDLIRKGKHTSAFDHFCKEGYSQIVKQQIFKIENSITLNAHIDNLIKIDDKTLYMQGWCYSEEDKGMEALSITAAQANAVIFHHPRADLKEQSEEHWEEVGFYGIIELEETSQADDELVFIFSLDDESLYVKKEITINDNAREISELILAHIEIHGEFREVFEKAIGPSLHHLWDKHYKDLTITPKMTSYGECLAKPELSIIVPLYGRIDFMEYQLAIFSSDHSFKRSVELIYVLDDPERFEDSIQDVAQALYNLTRVPFKVVTYEENLGYARANNVGVSFATAEKILLLNSDVFPRENKWISRMLEVYSTLEDPGVLGFKLLFEDNAVQHAGMIFEKNPYLGDMWTNLHPHKGMPDLEKEFLVKEVPAVTGACMLLEREAYLSVGGLSENYVLGDFEDSDLCLKLMEKGLKIYYSTEPSLYHLERQSQSLFNDQSWKFKITVFNCWQQTKQWDKTIEKTMEHFNA